MYIQRHAEEAVSRLTSMFGAVLVAGPRQVGKRTVLSFRFTAVSYDNLVTLKGEDLVIPIQYL